MLVNVEVVPTFDSQDHQTGSVNWQVKAWNSGLPPNEHVTVTVTGPRTPFKNQNTTNVDSFTGQYSIGPPPSPREEEYAFKIVFSDLTERIVWSTIEWT